MHVVKKILKLVGLLLVVLVVVALGGIGFLYWKLDTGQLSEQFRKTLAEALGTEVRLDDCRLHIMEQELQIHELTIKDHQQKDMLHFDTLEVKVDLFQLMYHHFAVHDFELYGATANIYRLPDSKQMNTQFVVDSLKALSPTQQKKKEHHNLFIDLRKCQIRRSSIHLTKMDIGLGNIEIHPEGDGNTHLYVRGVHLHTDNHKPRRNKVNPRRGAFDAKHLDLDLSFDAYASYLSTDSISMAINNLYAIDKVGKLELSSLTMDMQLANGQCHGQNLHLTSHQTSVTIPSFEMTLPSKALGRTFSMTAPTVKAHAILKDISKPFAPRLKNFTTPLDVTSGMTFSGHQMRITNAIVTSHDKRLRIKADGTVTFKGRRPNGKHKFDCRFTVHSMTAGNAIKNRIVGHFAALPPSLVNLLTHIGDIGFKGRLHVPYKHTYLSGILTTEIGQMHTDFGFSKLDHRIKGAIQSDSISLSTLTGNKNLGKLAFKADFNLILPRKKHGKKNVHLTGDSVRKAMPKGYLEGTAFEASYKRLRLRNIDFRIDCDGKKATGTLASINRLIDVSAKFSFVGSDIKHTLKVRPHIKVHNLLENTFLKKIFKRRYRKRMEKKAAESAAKAS